MFGYVTVYKDDLKVREYNRFRAYYCGLCKAIGKNCSQVTRLGLSYDMTFLAVLLSAVLEQPVKTEPKGCAVHPGVKRETVIGDEAVAYASYMSVLLVYLKFYDDWQDDRSLKALLGMAAYWRGVRRAKKQYKESYEQIRLWLKKLSALEKANCASIDETADCFAHILEHLFTPDFVGESKRILAWIGYNTGRWIYSIDAYHDMEKDFKKKSYNPFLAEYSGGEAGFDAYKKQVREQIAVSLTYTLDNLGASYELLKIHKNDEILRNIVYLGLKIKQDQILCEKEQRRETNEPL